VPPVGPEPGLTHRREAGDREDHPPSGPGAVSGLRGSGPLPESSLHRRTVRAVRHVPGGAPTGHWPLRGCHLRPAQGGGHRAGGADPFPGVHPLRRDRFSGGGGGDRLRSGLRGKIFGHGPLRLPGGTAHRPHPPGPDGHRGLWRGGPPGFPSPAFPGRPADDKGGILPWERRWACS